MKSVRGNLRVGHETVGTIGNYVTLKEALAEIDELRNFVVEIRDDPELPNSIRDDAENLAYKYRSK